MVKKYVFGTPIETDAVVKEIKETSWKDDIFQKEGNVFHYLLKTDEIVYGLGNTIIVNIPILCMGRIILS